MVVVNRMELGRELTRTLSQVNRQIEAVQRDAVAKGIEAVDMRDTNGNFVLIPLLAAKAQALHALTLANQRDR